MLKLFTQSESKQEAQAALQYEMNLFTLVLVLKMNPVTARLRPKLGPLSF